MKLQARTFTKSDNGDSWKLRAYVTLTPNERLAAFINFEDWQNELFVTAGIVPDSCHDIGGPFAGEPYWKARRHRVIIKQTGGLDI